MGATNFRVSGKGASARTVFAELREQALHEYGHGGYTGTIAEKHGFRVRAHAPMTMTEARAFIERDEESNDKWGPAYAIPYCTDEDRETVVGWIFYGMASC